MSKKLGAGFRELIVKLPNGMEVDFDLKKGEERQTYNDLMSDVEKTESSSALRSSALAHAIPA